LFVVFFFEVEAFQPYSIFLIYREVSKSTQKLESTQKPKHMTLGNPLQPFSPAAKKGEDKENEIRFPKASYGSQEPVKHVSGPADPPKEQHRVACYRCTICSREHDSKEEAMEHLFAFHVPKAVPQEQESRQVVRRTAFKCQKCGEEMDCTETFLDHMVQAHDAQPQFYGSKKVYCPPIKSTPSEVMEVTFGCSKCASTFTSREEMMEHVMQAHQKGPTDNIVFRCSHCEDSFDSKEAVLAHMDAQHNRNQVNYRSVENKALMSCPICNKGIDTRNEMAAHLRTHDSVNETLADSMEKEMFDDHVDGEANNTSYTCSECGTRMTSKVEILRHMRQKHGDGERLDETSASDDDETRGQICRRTDPSTGKSETVVQKDDGRQYIFDDDTSIRFVKMEKNEREDFTKDMCLLGLRGLVTEMGQRLVDESKLFQRKKKEWKELSTEIAFGFFGLTPSATSKEVNDAYKVQARLLHPDKNGGTDEAKAKFQRMKVLHEILRESFESITTPPESDVPGEQESGSESSEERCEAPPKQAYDEDDPIKKDDDSKTLSFDPRNRDSMIAALVQMCGEINTAWNNIGTLSSKMETMLWGCQDGQFDLF